MSQFISQPDAVLGQDTFLRSSVPTNNNGTRTMILATGNDVALLRFNLAAIPPSALCNGATLYLYQIATGGASAFTISAYSVTLANAAWIEGAKFGELAGAGEPCWNALAADGAGGVLTAWAGAAGCATAGVDYEADLLGSVAGNRSNANGTEYALALTAARVRGWFGGTNTNYGLLLKLSAAAAGGIGASDNVTAAYRPKLVVDYTLASRAKGVRIGSLVRGLQVGAE